VALKRHSLYLVVLFNPAMTTGRIGYAGPELLN
jgi:hypothetical protein